MIRFAIAVGLVCLLSYTLYPRECRVLVGRLEASARAASTSVTGAVRDVLPSEAHASRRRAPTRAAP